MHNPKIFFIFHGRYPSEKAAALFAAKSCEAFVKQGAEVILLVPRRLGRIQSDSFAQYGLEPNFRVVFLPTIDLFPVPVVKKIAFLTSFLAFSFSCVMHLLLRARKEDVVYSNESLPLFFASFFLPNTLYEIHDFPERKLVFYRSLLRRVKWILATNAWKEKALRERFGISEKKIIVEQNAVDITAFDVTISKEDARRKLGLPLDKRLAVYTGHLYAWKGVDTFAEAARYLSDFAMVIFVGGTEKDIVRFREKYGGIENILIAGYKNHSEIPYWQKAADVLVLPNTAKEDISKYYTSPMKLFEYMASKRPIVASRIPSITEILNEQNALLVNPDDPKALSENIQTILMDSEHAARITRKAFENVLEHSWSLRAKRILAYMKR